MTGSNACSLEIIPETVRQRGSRRPWGTCYCLCGSHTCALPLHIMSLSVKSYFLLSSTNCKVKRASLPQGMFSSTFIYKSDFYQVTMIFAFHSLVFLSCCHSGEQTFSSQYSWYSPEPVFLKGNDCRVQDDLRSRCQVDCPEFCFPWTLGWADQLIRWGSQEITFSQISVFYSCIEDLPLDTLLKAILPDLSAMSDIANFGLSFSSFST